MVAQMEYPMRLIILAALVFACATPLLADDQTPMTEAEFDAYVTGKTLTYADGGTVFGTEQYKPNNKVVWAFSGDECRDGTWYEKNKQICFVYEDPNDPQCWLFFMAAGGMKAQFMGLGGSDLLSEVQQSSGPMPCAGPDVGV
jgi:hypothetical protein